jgi:hypothetical protein
MGLGCFELVPMISLFLFCFQVLVFGLVCLVKTRWRAGPSNYLICLSFLLSVGLLDQSA